MYRCWRALERRRIRVRPGEGSRGIRRHGLIAALQQGGLRVSDLGDVAGCRWRADLDNPKAMTPARPRWLPARSPTGLRRPIETAGRVLVLGGDCQRSVTGAIAHFENIQATAVVRAAATISRARHLCTRMLSNSPPDPGSCLAGAPAGSDRGFTARSSAPCR